MILFTGFALRVIFIYMLIHWLRKDVKELSQPTQTKRK